MKASHLLGFSLGVGLLVSSVVGCATPPPVRGEPAIQAHIVSDFADHVPVDVAVLPVVDSTSSSMTFVKLMRSYATEELTGRLYSPLATQHVDKEIGGAHPRSTSYNIPNLRSRFGEDAILAIQVSDFDVDYLPGHRTVRVGGSFQLFNSGDGRLLWSRDIKNMWIDIPGPVQPGALRMAEKTAVREFVRFAFEDLPRRTVVGS